MNIRLAESKDAFALGALLAELGYADTAPFIERRLTQLIADETEQLLIAEHGNTVLGFLSLHFIPSWRWPGILPASATSALPKVSAARARGSSCCNMPSGWQLSVAVTVWKFTAISAVKRPMRFMPAKATANHRATISRS